MRNSRCRYRPFSRNDPPESKSDAKRPGQPARSFRCIQLQRASDSYTSMSAANAPRIRQKHVASRIARSRGSTRSTDSGFWAMSPPQICHPSRTGTPHHCSVYGNREQDRRSGNPFSVDTWLRRCQCTCAVPNSRNLRMPRFARMSGFRPWAGWFANACANPCHRRTSRLYCDQRRAEGDALGFFRSPVIPAPQGVLFFICVQACPSPWMRWAVQFRSSFRIRRIPRRGAIAV